MPVLMEFVFPKASPSPTGVKREVVYKVVKFPQTPSSTFSEKEVKRPWWEPLLPLLGIIIIIKLATWFARRKR